MESIAQVMTENVEKIEQKLWNKITQQAFIIFLRMINENRFFQTSGLFYKNYLFQRRTITLLIFWTSNNVLDVAI